MGQNVTTRQSCPGRVRVEVSDGGIVGIATGKEAGRDYRCRMCGK